MRKSWFQCSVLGGLIVFVWGLLSWMVLPWHAASMERFTDEEAVADVIRENTTRDGIYILPNMHDSKIKGSQSEIQRQYEESEMILQDGPLMFSSIKMTGTDPMRASSFVRSLIIQIAGAFLITWLLLQTRGLTYMGKVWFVSCIAFIVAILCYLPAWNWMFFPPAYVILNMIDLVIGWFLAGLVIARYAQFPKKAK